MGKAIEPSAEAADVMTVEDYARLASVNAIMLAGFKVALKSQASKPWRSRDEWRQAIEAFANAPA